MARELKGKNAGRLKGKKKEKMDTIQSLKAPGNEP